MVNVWGGAEGKKEISRNLDRNSLRNIIGESFCGQAGGEEELSKPLARDSLHNIIGEYLGYFEDNWNFGRFRVP